MSRQMLTRRPRRTIALATLAAAATVGSVIAAGPALAAVPAPGGVYLALGDSIPFGYVEPDATATPNYLDPTSLVGYPEDVASDLHLQVANAACPGETTVSYLKPGTASNGCENSPDSNGGSTNPGYRSGYLLHESYAGTQASYAQSFLRTHPNTTLVTLQLGANDGLLCQETTADQCQSEQGAVLNRAANNIVTILKQLRVADHYTGQIVLVTYYSLNYSNETATFQSRAVNGALTQKAAKYNAIVADGFGAFQQATAAYNGDPCAAGLLTQLKDTNPRTGNMCGIHPSPQGQTLLAQAVETALQGSTG